MLLPSWFAIGWAGVASWRARKQLGLSWGEFGQLLGLPKVAVHAGWAKPDFARLLTAEGDAPSARAPRTPEELTRAIGELSRRLRGAGLLPDNDIAAAAQSVRAAIDALNGEIGRLSADLDPAEHERVACSLGRTPASTRIRRYGFPRTIARSRPGSPGTARGIPSRWSG